MSVINQEPHKCQKIKGSKWYWNAIQASGLMTLVFQQTPALKEGITKADRVRAQKEWDQVAVLAVSHLGTWGMECISKGLLEKYGFTWPENEHKLGVLWNRLPLKLRVTWRNRFQQMDKEIPADLKLDEIISKYSNAYKVARYDPEKFDREGINLFTFDRVIRSGCGVFDSDVCYCRK